jgi:hypothetical protein
MKPWNPFFDPLKDALSSTPLWVRLPNFPLHFWVQTLFVPLTKHLKDTIMEFLKQRNETPQLTLAYVWLWTLAKDF